MSHLTHSQRSLIENGLKNGDSFKEIARTIGKAHTTVAREVLRHRLDSDKGAFGRILNRCVHRTDCSIHYLCSTSCNRKCSSCSKCNELCPSFREDVCEKLDFPPYVCNGCHDEHKCALRKKYYIHDTAENAYRELLSEARCGACLAEEEKQEVAELLSAGLRQGQSVHHILAANPDSFRLSEKSIYRYINGGILAHPRRGDLPMAPRMKPRRKKSVEHKVDTKCRVGRTKADYAKFQEAHPDCPEVEMDSVIGRVGGKVLLTIHFVNSSLMLAFLRDHNNSQSVIDVFNFLETELGGETFRRLFPVILTDNGSEFSNPAALETSPVDGRLRTRIFYCDPNASWQMPNVENNHLNLRKLFPKGQSLDGYVQEDVALALSHLNSFARLSLNNVPAFVLFETLYGKGILEKLHVQLIPATKVCLTPKLLGR